MMWWWWCATEEYREVGAIMRVTKKGQVTIPKAIRARLALTPGAEVDFVVAEDGRVYLTPAPRFAALRASATVRMSTDEIMALTRAEA